ncbi:FliO/MopB family protein [Kordiimonas aestuarii]|uniref:FliO/MopB family protein n=1 Tax=Kordiimonas aestuarii TaxID=1005925 RepID=UPI0021D2F347|nr:flagellar biosynthetic protein FliO [Kordiimonas aestuarii]
MEYLGVFSVLFMMLGALALMAWLVRRFGLLPGTHRQKPGDKELEIIASRLLDARNRLIVVRWRDRDYLIGTGANGVTRIDSKGPGFAEMIEAGGDAKEGENRG